MTEASFDVRIPGDAIAGSESYTVVVSSGLLHELLEGLHYLVAYPYGCLEQNVNRFLPALTLHEVLTEAKLPSALDAKRLREQVEKGCESLSAWQTVDGSFSYWPGGPPHPWATALALEALGRSSAAGYRVNSSLWSFALAGAHRMIRDARTPSDARAALLLAIVHAGGGDRDVATALFRKRQTLSVAGLARLLMASKSLGLGDRLELLAKELAGRSLPAEHPKRRGGRVWPQSRLESAALLLQASLEVEMPSVDQAQLATTVRKLLRRRQGGTKAVAVAIEALALYGRDRIQVLDAAPVRVFVDGRKVVEGRLGGSGAPLALEIPASSLAKGKHRIRIERGTGGPARVDLLLRNVQNGVQTEGDGNLLSVRRRLTPWQDPDRKVGDHEPGYSIFKPEHRPAPVEPPSLAQAVVGTRLSVELVVTAREDLRWLVIEDPQLAGCEIIESGVRGNFDRFERRQTRALFFKNHLRKGQSLKIVYPAYAVHQGHFAALPTRASAMYEPEIHGRSASASLEIVADAKMLAVVEEAKPTPDELHADAMEAWKKKAYATAIDLLTPLAKTAKLREEVMDEVTRVLWLSHLRLGHHRKAVDLEEELRLRNPRKISIGVKDQDRMGRAWMALGDPEMAQRWFDFVALHGFQEDWKVASTYQGIGRNEAQVQHLRETLLRYPVDLTGGSWLKLPEQLLRMSNPSLGKKAPLLPRAHRVRWQESQEAYLDLMAWWSGSDLASRAARARLDTWRRLDLKKRLIAEGRRYLARFEKSSHADQIRWNLARAHFELEEFADAAREAQLVWDWRAPGTSRRRSSHRSQAGYLLGKVAHVKGETEEAVRWYGRVKNSVQDARQSWLFFTEKKLEVDPVTRTATKGPAKVTLRVKNLDEVNAQVYPVDLLVLFSMKKSFDRLSVADLSGIKPAKEVKVEPGLSRYEAGECALELGTLDPGAYLVMIRGGELNAGTLLQVSDARVTIQRQNGSLRVYLVDGDHKPIAGAKVRMAVGTRIFHSGETDVRGMLSVNDPGRGTITVVATGKDAVAVGTHR